MAHNRSVLKERRIYTLVLSPVLQWQSAGTGAGDQCLDGVWRISAGGAPRDMFRCGLVVSKGLG